MLQPLKPRKKAITFSQLIPDSMLVLLMWIVEMYDYTNQTLYN